MSADFPLPDTEWERTRPFWEAAAREELVLPRCASCATLNWYPGPACKACGHENYRWDRLSGRATLFAWTVVRHGFVKPFRSKVPYITGLVCVDEDPSVRLVTTLVDCDPDELEADLPMQVVFRPLSFPDVEREVIAPMFTPSERNPS